MKHIVDPTERLLASEEPWVRYRVLTELKGLPADSREVVIARGDTLAHPALGALMDECAAWPGKPVSRHNDASLPMHRLAFLADWGFDASVPEIGAAGKRILAKPSPKGALQSLIQVPATYGGTGEPALG